MQVTQPVETNRYHYVIRCVVILGVIGVVGGGLAVALLAVLTDSFDKNNNPTSAPTNANKWTYAPTNFTNSTGFNIDFMFNDQMPEGYKAIFYAAAQRWEKVITNDLPDTITFSKNKDCYDNYLPVENVTVDDLLIYITVKPIDGVGKVLAKAGPCVFSYHENITYPRLGTISIDADDATRLYNDQQLLDVTAHEIGHVLGIGTLNSWFAKLKQEPGLPLRFMGDYARSGSAQLGLDQYPPIQENGVSGTDRMHPAEATYPNALMSPYLGPKNILSHLEAGFLQDLGYAVNHAAVEDFIDPGVGRRALRGLYLD